MTWLQIADEFFDPAATTAKRLLFWVPKCEGQSLISRLAGLMCLLLMFAFGVFGAAMFTEPTVTEIEKVIRLIQGGSP